MIRLLVTGVSGLLGLNLAWLASDRFHVIGVLRGSRAAAAPGRTPFETIQADLTMPGEVERVLDQAEPDVLVHCAALTDIDYCEQHPELAFRSNALLAGNVASAAAARGVGVVHISTDAVFDGQRGDYCETDAPAPVNVYGHSKLAGERAVAEANPDALIARVNFYGWSWQGRRSLSEWFYNNLSAGRAVRGFTDLLFNPLLVNDMVEILLRMIALRLSGLYHVASAESLSKFAFGRMLARHFGLDENLVSPASFKTGGLRAPRSPHLTLRTERLTQSLGETLPLQEPAMRRYFELFQQGYPQRLRSMFVEADPSRA